MSRPPPLAGLVVAERGGRLAAAVASTLLGGLGATVLRLEDDAGRPASDPPAWHRHPVVLGGKSRLAAGGDADAAWRSLSGRAHVALVSTPPADGPASAASLTVALTAFGAGDPDFAASELAVQAVSGAMATTGLADGPPCVVQAPLLEMLTGINAATSVLAALRAGTRETTLDLAVLDSALVLAGTFHPQALVDPGRLFRNGARHPLCCPWNAYRATDGWVTLCIASDEQWRRCAELIGRPDLGADPELASSPQRVAAAARIDAAVTAWTSTRTVAETAAQLRTAGLPVSAVCQPGPQTAAVVSTVAAGDGSNVAVPGPPLWLSESPLREMAPIGALEPARIEPLAAPPSLWRSQAAGGAPLAGLRVIEIGPYTAGPLAGRYLSDLGAEVIKVEPPDGENSRSWQPRVGHVSAYFANYNCGKRSVTLELAVPEDAARLRELIAGADVFLHSMKPGSLSRLGIDVDALARASPRLIACCISGYGRNAPPAPALDTVVQAGSGLMALVAGTEDEGPLKTGFSYGDLTAAHVATLGILAAITERDRSGRGQNIDVPMHDALVWLVQLGWPGIPVPPFAVHCADGIWTLVVPGETPAPVLNIAAAVQSSAARRRAALRRVVVGGGGAWMVLAPPHRWRAAEPAVGTGVAQAGADNGTFGITQRLQTAEA